MMRSKVLALAATIFCLFFLKGFFSVVLGASPKLYFEPAVKTLKKDEQTQVQIKIDSDGVGLFGADAVFEYQTDDIEVSSIENGGFFPQMYPAVTSGRVEIHAFSSAMYDTRTGAGTVAKFTIKSKKDSGTSNIVFKCGTSTESQILDKDGKNVLNCGVLNQVNITFSSTGTGGTGEDTNDNTTQEGERNSCGGTCGSNINCKDEYYCFNGFCRNPSCQYETDCTCPNPTPVKSPTPKPKKASPTPVVITLTDTSDLPSPTPDATATPEAEPKSGVFGNKNLISAIVALILAGVVMWLYSFLKRRKANNPPEIDLPNETPPTTPEVPNL